MKLKILHFTIVFLAFIGIILVSTTIHEGIHYLDLKGKVTPQNICIANIPLQNISLDSAAAFYQFSFNDSVKYDLESMKESTELRAEIISTIVLIVGGFLITYYTLSILDFL